MGLNHLTRASSTLARVRARYTFNNATTLSRPEACWATRPNLVVVRRSFSTRGNLLMIDNSPAISASLVPPSIRDLQDQDQPVQKDARIQDDFDDIRQGRGKLSPTSSHLFKLILPLGGLDLPADERKSLYTPSSSSKRRPTPPTIMLLHPSQPLSHVASLIRNSIRSGSDKSRRANPGPDVTFVSTSTRGQPYQWSETTDIGDFVRDAARRKSFSVELDFSDAEFLPEPESEAKSPPRVTSIEVDVPTFQDRTSFLRRRLFHIQSQLQQMEGLKVECDRMAHKGAKRLAIGGFGMLVVYWGAVARLTFWDYGWDVMEPVTYLSGLTTVVCGYLWFLYQGRDVSYTSVLHRSVDARKEALYREKGFDIERWSDLKDEERGTRREIGRIAEEYDVQTDDGETEDRKRTNGGNGKGEKDEDEEEGECGVSKKVEEAGDEIEKKIESVEEVEDGAEDKKRN